ncbi:adenosine kinase [Pseudooceanicola sediminis]|uniref:Adenosine kinase n=1 Tax=Pseudooceanicola sediminis TaxID=2211117 RepID=A0A399IYU3_9RHOB|nr:adenosine kinase [Pseudooceanicola sediminis]KAA2313359.1 adenosine kinase [Puniceibacterium sp. HSS470]RII38358.1 adenosine kinase [Pseudooceanicola sediminis]|tara:strand:+ start:7989 stop:8975 length:987 start_codon:yes stop_codon:yes gene_type:complete
MTKYDVIGIGNAVMDVISQNDDAFLSSMGIEKGIMQLIEQERAEVLYGAMQSRRQIPGGSVANSVAGVANLGLKTAFIGKVSDDDVGMSYAAETRAGGTDFPNEPVAGGTLPSSRSMIFVSPDGERSMNTYLGISSEVGPDDVPEEICNSARILFLEGYLYDKDKGKEAFKTAARLVRSAGGMAGIALSDPFCVDRHRADFRRLVKELDYVIGNEHEWKSLYETDDLGAALETAASESGLVVCTRSGHDVVIVRGDQSVTVPVRAITPVDATGAGDLFASGFLYGLATGADIETSGRMGCVAAAEVISHYGARPEADLKALFAAEGLM